MSTEIEEKYKSLQQNLKNLEAKVAEYRKIESESCKKEKECIKEIKEQKAEINKWLKSIKKEKNPDTIEKKDEIYKRFTRIASLFPRPPGLVLSLALGKNGPFVIHPIQARQQYKKDYEAFKLNYSLVTSAFALFNLFIFKNRILDILYIFLILYYFSSVTLREHILLVNGSRIRSWWLGHHYSSVILSCTILLWPYGETFLQFRTLFYLFSVYLGIVQFFQYKYQTKRLYTLRALSVIGPMDTFSGDGAHINTQRDFFLLIPFLSIAQLWQIYNSYFLFNLYMGSTKKEWQVITSSIFFGVLGIGNLFTTVRTYIAKIKTKHEKKTVNKKNKD